MSTYDIRAAVRAVLDETDLTSPDEIAAKVAGNVPSKDLRTVLAHVLREYVRIELGRDRMSNSYPPPSAHSAKVAAIRDAAPQWLRDRVSTDSGWLLIGECTFDHLRYLESERLANAARSTAKADGYRRLAELVRRHKVARVADLPARVLAGFEWRLPE